MGSATSRKEAYPRRQSRKAVQKWWRQSTGWSCTIRRSTWFRAKKERGMVTTGRQPSRNSRFSWKMVTHSSCKISTKREMPVFSGASFWTPGPGVL